MSKIRPECTFPRAQQVRSELRVIQPSPDESSTNAAPEDGRTPPSLRQRLAFGLWQEVNHDQAEQEQQTQQRDGGA